MPTEPQRLHNLRPFAVSLLRLVVGFTFSLHGFQLVLGFFGGSHGAPAPLYSLVWVAGIIELLGGLLLLFGVTTRPVAFVLSGEMAVAYFLAHFPKSFWPIENGGELSALYAFVFLYLAIAGAGPISVDALLNKRPKATSIQPAGVPVQGSS
jgi:putative oxidoreductase